MSDFYQSPRNNWQAVATSALTAPASAAELAEYLGLIADSAAEEAPNGAMLDGLLLAATQAVIDATGWQIVPRDFTYTADSFPALRPPYGGVSPIGGIAMPWLCIPIMPVVSIACVKAAGVVLLAGVDYTFDQSRIMFQGGAPQGAIEVGFTAGQCDAPSKMATLAAAAFMYEHRGGCSAEEAVKSANVASYVKRRRTFAGGL